MKERTKKKPETTPLIRSLSDVIDLPLNFDEKEAYSEYLLEKFKWLDLKKENMETQFDISEIIERGEITNELDIERALIADRKLRVLSKEDPKFKSVRKKLRNLIEQYKNKNWRVE